MIEARSHEPGRLDDLEPAYPAVRAVPVDNRPEPRSRDRSPSPGIVPLVAASVRADELVPGRVELRPADRAFGARRDRPREPKERPALPAPARTAGLGREHHRPRLRGVSDTFARYGP